MSTQNNTDLPDEVYGAADCNVANNRRLRVSYTPSEVGGPGLLHAHLGGVYVAMTERNWRAVFAALSQLEVKEPPARTIRISMDDERGEAHVEVTA